MEYQLIRCRLLRVVSIMALSAISGVCHLAAEKINWPDVMKKGEEPGLRRVVGEDQWYFLPSDLRHLATSFEKTAPAPTGQDPVTVVTEFSKGLKEKGVQLILLPVPEKPKIRADRLVKDVKAGDASQTKELDQASGRFLNQLREAGVEVFDPSTQFQTWVSQGLDPVYCRSDTHYTPQTCERLAAILVKSSETLGGLKNGKKFTLSEADLEIKGDLADDGETEKLKMKVLNNPATGKPFSSDDESPVLLMGDSHCLVFHSGGDMHTEGAGLFDHLTAQLGFPPALLAVRGSGANSARVALYRKAKRAPEFLKAKKVLIWCFAAREFTQNEGWKKIPLP